MGCKSYKAKAPGSLMLLGEHAVLHGKQAIVAAINHYIHVELTLRQDRKIQIISSEFGKHQFILDKLKIAPPYNYVLAVIQQYLKKIPCGFTLKITSDFHANFGLGSSAAVTVATLGALATWLEKKPLKLINLYKQATKIIRLVHKVGSGADVAASVFGGVLAYQTKPLKIKHLTNTLPLVAVYSGNKMPTNKVIAEVEKLRRQFPTVFTNLYDTIGRLNDNANFLIKKQNLIRLGKIFNLHQGMQDSLGVNNATLSELIFALRAMPNIYGAKISGAGLGDCVIGLGKIPAYTFPKNNLQKKLGIKQINIKVSPIGYEPY